MHIQGLISNHQMQQKVNADGFIEGKCTRFSSIAALGMPFRLAIKANESEFFKKNGTTDLLITARWA